MNNLSKDVSTGWKGSGTVSLQKKEGTVERSTFKAILSFNLKLVVEQPNGYLEQIAFTSSDVMGLQSRISFTARRTVTGSSGGLQLPKPKVQGMISSNSPSGSEGANVSGLYSKKRTATQVLSDILGTSKASRPSSQQSGVRRRLSFGSGDPPQPESPEQCIELSKTEKPMENGGISSKLETSGGMDTMDKNMSGSTISATMSGVTSGMLRTSSTCSIGHLRESKQREAAINSTQSTSGLPRISLRKRLSILSDATPKQEGQSLEELIAQSDGGMIWSSNSEGEMSGESADELESDSDMSMSDGNPEKEKIYTRKRKENWSPPPSQAQEDYPWEEEEDGSSSMEDSET